jgi:hypothetical protein
MSDVSAPTKRLRRFGMIGMATVLTLVLAGCTGRGGGVLAPTLGFTGQATIGFSFTCENGRLQLSLEYQDHATNPFGGPFSIHGVADKISPALESYFCVGDASNGALPAGEILFQGTYTVQSGRPGMFDPAGCAATFMVGTGEILTGCRFTADVRDSGARGPSKGDYLSIKLFGGPDTGDTMHTALPIYARDGYLASGNFQVDNP